MLQHHPGNDQIEAAVFKGKGFPDSSVKGLIDEGVVEDDLVDIEADQPAAAAFELREPPYERLPIDFTPHASAGTEIQDLVFEIQQGVDP